MPRASWDSDEYKDRVAYIRTVNDTAVPVFVQQMMIDNAKGAEWVVKDIESDHSPQLSKPDELCEILLEFARRFEDGGCKQG